MSDAVFFALSDPIRRQILERLVRQGPSRTTTLLEGLGSTRQGAARHLKVLEICGLIISKKQGREVIRDLNPELLRGTSDWLSQLETDWNLRLNRLSDSHKKADC